MEVTQAVSLVRLHASTMPSCGLHKLKVQTESKVAKKVVVMKYTLKPLFKSPASLLTVLLLGAAFQRGYAVPISGTYTVGGTTAGTGPWNMTSTDSTFAVLRFVLDTPVAFQDITDLNYGYDSNLGGIGGGAPRAVFVLDNNNDNVADADFAVHWGPAGSFVDTTIANNLNTGNLLALTDVGRYDLGNSGGSAYTDRTAALALAGTWNVLRISLIIDSFGGNDRDFDINSVNVGGAGGGAVPDAGNTLALFGLGVVGLAGFSYRSRTRTA